VRLISRMMVGAVLAGGAVVAFLSTAAWGSTKPSAFDNQSSPVVATVRILAMSSSSRQNFAGNEEVYLADVSVKSGEQHQFVRLIDQYPGFGLPIRVSLLKQQTVFQMQLTREPECDEPGASVYLRPGESSVYDGSVRDTLAAHHADPIPCYKTLHQTIVTAKK
jgi:hypothetical protein